MNFWLAWALVGAAAEVVALVRHRRGDTLSESFRSTFDRPRVRRWAIAAWITFAAWFTVHIWW